MKILTRIILFSLLIISHLLNSQNEFSKWYFGNGAGLDFMTNPPTPLSSSSQTFFFTEGVATISDQSGNLLFYTDGMDVYTNQGTVMANGSYLMGSWSSTQSATIVKKPGSQNLYYVFTTCHGGVLPSSYSVVDMNLAAGQGSVVVKNVAFNQTTSEKQVVVRHCNGADVWIVSHDYGVNTFRAVLLTSTGISSTPVLSNVGPILLQNGNNDGAVAGQLKVSPSGRKLAMAQADSSLIGSQGREGFYLFDFDPATGVVSNAVHLQQRRGAYGVEFSPDGTKLYGCTIYFTGYYQNPLCLNQWNLCAGSNSNIVASIDSLPISYNNGGGSLQRAINGKIYFASDHTSSFLDVIDNPNGLGSLMNYQHFAQGTLPGVPSFGLPNFINSYTKPIVGLFTETVSCQYIDFSAPTPTYAGGCISNINPVNSYLWNFGDPSSGSSNTSTLANPGHLFSGIGTYTVKLILYSNCTNDTVLKTVSITSLTPFNVNVHGNPVICIGERRVFFAKGASSYLWSNNVSTYTAALSPTITTVYSVVGTLNGCKASKTFTVFVEPCVGISDLNKTSGINIYPNPFTDELSVEVEETTELDIIDVTGRTVLNIKVQKGLNTINTANLKAGVYILSYSSNGSVFRFRVVKSE